jgi:Polyketide cyclase / dehydrase and lipid transport
VVEAEADIRRPAEEVFDYASDPANEPGWNIRLKRIQKLTGGPVGVGARFRVEFTQAPAAISECVRFDRPRLWERAGGSKIVSSVFSGRVEPRGEHSHLLLQMQRELERDVVMIKDRLECAAHTAAGPPRSAPSAKDDPRERGS